MGDNRLDQHEFDAFLRSLLEESVVCTPPPPSQSAPPPASQSASGSIHLASQQMLQEAGGQVSAQIGSDLLAEGATTGTDRRRPVMKNTSRIKRRLRLKELERQLKEQQQQLRQLSSRRLYLTERVKLLEQLIQLHEWSGELSRQFKAGLSYNPLAVWDTTVQEFEDVTSQPSWVMARMQHQTQCLADRLASCTSLLQKYPQLVTHTPPAEVLSQLVTELSLAEPSNPYGADGLPIGSLTVPVPETVISKFAAAYNLDIENMSHAEQAMVACCAALVVEQRCCHKLYQHMFHLRPSIFSSDAVRLDAAACHTSWEQLISCLSRLQVDNSSDSVADKAHWEQVAKSAGLTDKQKLQAAVLWDILFAAQQANYQQRSQLLSQINASQQGLHANEPSTMTWANSSREQKATAAYEQSAEHLTQQDLLMKHLNKTLVKERDLKHLISLALFGCILSPVQVARIAVHSHPFVVATGAEIVAACAAECTPDMVEALAAETRKDEGTSMLGSI